VVDLCNLGVTLDLYEKNAFARDFFFTSPKWFWDNTARQLRTDGIALTMTTVHGTTFDRAEYGSGIKSHIHCEKSDGGSTGPLKPVQRSRGFNHLWT
ncbi:hypothetical protein PMAYCL1PPCAC_21289, partial [Pristionchus mayeri]